MLGSCRSSLGRKGQTDDLDTGKPDCLLKERERELSKTAPGQHLLIYNLFSCRVLSHWYQFVSLLL